MITNKTKKLINFFKKTNLIEDRFEYDQEDLQLAYPNFNKKEIKSLYLELKKQKRKRLMQK